MHARTRALATSVLVGLALASTACSSQAERGAARVEATATTSTSTSPSAALTPSLLPEPSGPFAIGIRTVPSVSPDATTRLWYPAQRGTGTGDVPYVTEAVAASQGTSTQQLHDVRVRAREDADPLPGTPRPAVVLMPGWASPMAVSTTLAEELASNGYVVVAVDPALGSEDPMTLPPDIANPARRLEQVAAALAFVAGPDIAGLAGPVDPARVALGGHSIAGAVGYQVSITDRRVHAVFDLDGRLPTSALATPTAVPVLVVEASGIGAASEQLIARTPHAVTVKLNGATHFDVTDLPCLAPAFGPDGRSLLGLGTIGRNGTTTTNAVVRRFLDAVLRDGRAVPPSAELTDGLDGVAG